MVPHLVRLSLAALVALSLVSCGDDAPSPTSEAAGGPTATPTAAANDASFAPQLDGPATKYTLLHEDLGPGYLTDVQGTFVLDAASYGATAAFDDAEQGRRTLEEWGYIGGFETGYIPEQRETAVLNGGYYINIESHLFEDEAGARAAFEYFADRIDSSPAERVSAPPLGNESAAWRLVSGRVPSSTVEAVFHRYLFRRGNLVVIVATWGAEPLMSIEHAFELARIVDEKALGLRPVTEPTPSPTRR